MKSKVSIYINIDHSYHLENLKSYLRNGRHALIIAPRGFDEASLVYKAVYDIMQERFGVSSCEMDLLNIYSIQGFLDAILKGLRSLYQQHNKQPFEFPSMEEKILDLPEFAAINLNVKLIFVVGNFHNLLRFDPKLLLFKRIKERWRRHKHCVYCLYGNKEHLNRKLINIPRHPAFGFLKIISLSMPGTHELNEEIKSVFRNTGKEITNKVAHSITIEAGIHPYYVSLLTWYAWVLTDKICTESILEEAIYQMMKHLDLYFRQKAESLTPYQLNFLKAYMNNGSRLTSANILKEFELGSSANVARIKDSLARKEIIEVFHGEIQLLDPLFATWLKCYYFR